MHLTSKDQQVFLTSLVFVTFLRVVALRSNMATSWLSYWNKELNLKYKSVVYR